MYAIIVTGGKQYKVSEGDVLFIEKKDIAEGETVKFDEVLAVSDAEGNFTVNPANASVEASVVAHGKIRKLSFTSTNLKKVTTKSRDTDSLIQRLKSKKSTYNKLKTICM